MSETSTHPGRGPRLPQTRITVQDLLPHFQCGESDEEIGRRYPTIGVVEVQFFRQYFLDHRDEVLAYQKQIAAFHAELRRKYDRPSPTDAMSPAERRAYLQEKLVRKLAAEANGAHGSA